MLPLLVLGLLFLCDLSAAYNITYDRRSLIVDGKRQLLVSGCIHYPRSTPQMWPELIAKAKAGGLNTIQTYVFWNAHQPTPDTYNFDDNLDLPQFLRLCQEAGMWVNLRIGPYVCAEWNLGGFPEWLLEVPGIEWRTNNPAFEAAVGKWVTYLVRMLQSQKMFASQGGPIILAQIENEYGNVQNAFPGHTQYVQWCANFAQSLNISVPWIMCQQSDAPAGIINTCNGFYCDGFEPNSPNSPKMWTENWPGWFQNWGQPRPRRPAEDVAFAAARFYARGGSYQNYYMYHGGTNFGRWVGGPNIVTSYDYDVQLDEYGLEQEPKYSHTARLHNILQANANVLLAYPEPPATPLGQNTEAHIYGQTTGGPCFAFLSNYDSSSDHTVTFNGAQYNLPAWSVSLLPDCKTVQYNTAQVAASAKQFTMRPVGKLGATATAGWQWNFWADTPGVWGTQPIIADTPQEQIRTTHDTTDYLWYVTYVQRSAPSSEKISVGQAEDVHYVYVNGQKLDTDTAELKAGNNSIAILTMTMGLINYGAQMQSVRKGLLGKVTLNGVDITQGKWYHQVGLQGEAEQAFNYNKKLNWQPFTGGKTSPLTWYHTTVPTPSDAKYLALDLTTLNKGAVWINGHHLGRYYLAVASGNCDQCDYRGSFNPSKCRAGCGVPSQQWYHCPPGWLQPVNEIVILDEAGGADLSGVQFVSREVGVVCGNVGENYPAEDLFVELECTGTQTIKAVQFASFGTPVGYCRRFQRGTCHSANSTSVVEQLCLNKRACAVPATVAEFGDPCPSTTKSLAVQVLCG